MGTGRHFFSDFFFVPSRHPQKHGRHFIPRAGRLLDSLENFKLGKIQIQMGIARFVRQDSRQKYVGASGSS